jgi:hypothetical protein
MRRLLAIGGCVLLAPALALAQSARSQSALQDDCLQRLRPLLPREVKAAAVDFSALGAYATYYLVSWRFTGTLHNGQRTAACTYRRDGEWVRDDAAAYKTARDLESPRPRAKAD